MTVEHEAIAIVRKLLEERDYAVKALAERSAECDNLNAALQSAKRSIRLRQEFIEAQGLSAKYDDALGNMR